MTCYTHWLCNMLKGELLYPGTHSLNCTILIAAPTFNNAMTRICFIPLTHHWEAILYYSTVNGTTCKSRRQGKYFYTCLLVLYLHRHNRQLTYFSSHIAVKCTSWISFVKDSYQHRRDTTKIPTKPSMLSMTL